MLDFCDIVVSLLGRMRTYFSLLCVYIEDTDTFFFPFSFSRTKGYIEQVDQGAKQSPANDLQIEIEVEDFHVNTYVRAEEDAPSEIQARDCMELISAHF